jgi:threonine dehydrogenase-like Zn-dependent dehydrogenase
MISQMKALVLEEYNRLVCKDVPLPSIKDDEVLVKVMACGICGSDVHGLDGSTGRRIPPLIMGHEASGIISETGSAVIKFKKGDRVTFDSTVYPLNDWYTLRGSYNLSNDREVIGVSPGPYRRNGAFAEYIAIPQHILYKIADNVSFEQAAVVEAAAVAMHGINISGTAPGDACIVAGTGTIGLFLIKLLKIFGTSKIFATDINPAALEAASRAGADMTFPAGEKDIQEKVRLVCNGRGADIAFEAAGKNESVNLAIDLVRRGGKVVLIGNSSPMVDIPLQKVVTGELKLLGSCAIRGEYEIILDLMKEGRLNVDDQILAVAPLAEGAEWFRKLYNKETAPGKVILVP